MVSILQSSFIVIVLITHIFSALVEIELLEPETEQYYQTGYQHNLFMDEGVVYIEHANSGVIRELTRIHNCVYGASRHYFGDSEEDPQFIGCRFTYGDRRYVQRSEFFSFLRRELDRNVNSDLGDYDEIKIIRDKEEVEVIDWNTVGEKGEVLRRAVAFPGVDWDTKKTEKNIARINDLYNAAYLLGNGNGAQVFLRLDDLINFQRKILRLRKDAILLRGTIYDKDI
jgi:hypothetical protein